MSSYKRVYLAELIINNIDVTWRCLEIKWCHCHKLVLERARGADSFEVNKCEKLVWLIRSNMKRVLHRIHGVAWSRAWVFSKAMSSLALPIHRELDTTTKWLICTHRSDWSNEAVFIMFRWFSIMLKLSICLFYWENFMFFSSYIILTCYWEEKKNEKKNGWRVLLTLCSLGYIYWANEHFWTIMISSPPV